MAEFTVAAHHRLTEVVGPRSRPGSVRVWDGDALVAGTCRVCGVLSEAESLRNDRAAIGGRRLLCVPCEAARSRADRELYGDMRSAKRRAWESANREHMRRQSREYHAANREQELARKRTYREANRDLIRERNRTYREAQGERSDADLSSAMKARWPGGTKPCPVCVRSLPLTAFGQNRSAPGGLQPRCRACTTERASLRRVRGALDMAEERDNWRCTYCGVAPVEHWDHVHASSKGGLDVTENLVGACASCNLSKRATDLFEWRPDFLALVGDWEVEVRRLVGT